jgi:4a-hydroxytetrahydrobiopterin dehydratase
MNEFSITTGARQPITRRSGASGARIGSEQQRRGRKSLTEVATMAKLSADEIAGLLGPLAGWEYRDGAIRKLYRFKEFMDGIDFVNRVAEMAEAADHHPDIAINYTRVTFSCATHSEGGVTQKDIDLAANIESAFADTQR